MRASGVPGLVVGLVVLVLAIGIGVWLTSSGEGGPSAAPTEREEAGDPAAERRDARADRRDDAADRREDAADLREERLDELEDRGGSDNGPG